MTKSNSIASYPHCKAIWDEAYASPTGSTVIGRTEGLTKSEQATLIGDLLHYRVLVRKDNNKFFPEGHPSHGTSIFDPFSVTKVNENGKMYVRIRRKDAKAYSIDVEDL